MFGTMIALSLILLVISFIIQVFVYTINALSDKIFGTQYNKVYESKRVRFTDDKVILYELTKEEREMKKKAYKRIRRASRHYRQMDYLCHMMEDMKISN